MDKTSDVIDKAMDAAEAQITEATAKEPESVPEDSQDKTEEIVVAKAIQEKAKAKEPEAKEEELTEEAESAPEETENLTDQTTDEEATEAESTEDESLETAPIDAPTFWSADHKGIFAKLPAEAKQAIQHYEQQRNQYVSRVVGEAKRGMELEKSLSEVFEPQRARLQAQGCRDVTDAVTRLLAWDETFTSDPMTGIADLMRKNNITPYDFLSENGDNRYQSNPAIEEARRDAQAAKEAAEALRVQIEGQEKQRTKMQVEAFKEGRDSHGQSRRVFAEMYAPQIDRAFQDIVAQNPMLPFEQALNNAYESVMNVVHQTLGINPANPKPKAKTPEKIQAETKKALAASGSVKGAPASGISTSRPRLKGKSFNEKLDSAMDAAEEQIGAR